MSSINKFKKRGKGNRSYSNKNNYRNKQSYRSGKSNFQRNHRNNNNTRKDPNHTLSLEYNPPFLLGARWESKEHYKLKIQHPFFQNEKETVSFPIYNGGHKSQDRAIFYSEVLEIQNSVQFEAENGPLLYYTFRRCLKADPLNDWKEIVITRNTDAQQ